MKNLVAALLLAGALVMPAEARNFAVPDKNPAVLLAVPDNWTVDEIEYGYNAFSPDKDVFFAVEYANRKNLAAMMKNNEKWMAKNKIKMVPGKQAEVDIHGISTTVFQFETTDANGPTIVEFMLMPAGNDRMVFLTFWGSPEERKKHEAALESILNSIKPL